MPKKKKNALPSGSFRVQVYDYTDKAGKKHYKSFTAPTKRQAQALAADWKANREKMPETDMTLYEAVGRYIDLKRAVLSPSTLTGYTAIQKTYFSGDFGKHMLSSLTNIVVQTWVSDLSVIRSPKTVRNAYGLLSATLDVFMPDLHLKSTLPAKKRPELYCPSDDDVKKLLEHIKGTDLEIAVMLAAFGPLRRGEICALTSDDIHGNTITVSKSMVQEPDNQWYIKQPKTYGSYREIDFPDFVIDRIKDINGKIVNATPSRISGLFIKAITETDVPRFRFHDLRHYAASIMHAIGVPDQYILKRGGWISDNVMKSVYRNAIDSETVKQNKKINDHFKALSST
jgi:integrase